jgi:hypothetical protein
LNGRPVFLRGNAINPPGRNLPDSIDESRKFVEGYVRFMKSINVNIIRLSAPSQIWFDVADELGLMIFQGHYGTPKDATSTSAPKVPLTESMDWYRNAIVGPQANHPSVVIYALSNEQAAKEIGYLSSGHAEVARFLQAAYDTLSRWDDTRLYIGNAGYGFGRAGEICDLHRYWGWYYNSFLSFYTLRDPKICWRSDAIQPMTLTENTGNYTGPDGRFNLASKTKQPDSQLNWTGHAPDSEQSARSLAYQAWMGGQATEITRRLRARNPYLAGLSPFTILFSNWANVRTFGDMGPKPITRQFARSYQPVLLSWESWTPQLYAGSTFTPVIHVVNDAETGEVVRGASLRWSLRATNGRIAQQGTLALGDVAYYSTVSQPLPITIPANVATGAYTLAGTLTSGRDTISHNETELFIAARDFATTRRAGTAPTTMARRVRVFDSAGTTLRALATLGLPASAAASIASLEPRRDALVIGAGAWTPELTRDSAALRSFVAAGGRVLILEQSPDRFSAEWLPGGVHLQTQALDHPDVFPGGRPFKQGMAVNPERPDHPVFDGLSRDRFFLWSDYTNWNEARPGFPAVYPVTHGFAFLKPEQLGSADVLANYDHGLQGVALAELYVGEGSALLSGFDLLPRVGRDPVADRLLSNLVRWVASGERHEAHPLITSKITWGDYASERGVANEIYNGLLLHTVPRVPAHLADKYPLHTDDEGFAYAGTFGGWNTRPSIQYVAHGRRPFGPYEFTSGGSVRVIKGSAPTGEGRVWLRVPGGRSTMTTTVMNPATEPLDVEISLNGATQRQRVGAGETARIESPLKGATSLAIGYRGDRRLVLLETEFK